MRTDDNVDEMVKLVLTSGKLLGNDVIKVIRWFLENGRDNAKFTETNGLTDMKKLHEKTSSVKFLPNEVDENEMKMISRQFKKYNVLFAVDKQENGNYVIAFAAKNIDTIEYAMKQVVKEQDRKMRHAKSEARKPTAEKIKQRWREYMGKEGREERNTEQKKEQSQQRAERSL